MMFAKLSSNAMHQCNKNMRLERVTTVGLYPRTLVLVQDERYPASPTTVPLYKLTQQNFEQAFCCVYGVVIGSMLGAASDRFVSRS